MANLWKLPFLALAAMAAMPEPVAAHNCRVKVSIADIKYDGDDIGGNTWDFIASAGLNMPKVLTTKKFSNALKPDQLLNTKSLIIEEKLGVFKGQPVEFVIQTESWATETRGTPKVFGMNGKSEIYRIEKCGVPHRFEYIAYAVPVQRDVKTAQMRFVYKVEIDP